MLAASYLLNFIMHGHKRRPMQRCDMQPYADLVFSDLILSDMHGDTQTTATQLNVCSFLRTGSNNNFNLHTNQPQCNA